MREWSRRATITLLLAGLCARAAILHAQTPLEYPVKAAFLLNFARFVEWPDAAFSSPSAPLTICIIGPDPFATVLDETVQGELVNRRPVLVNRAPRADQLPLGASCHIAFMPGKSASDADALSVFRRTPTLTVGEEAQFLSRGGCINFVLEENKVRFEISEDAAKRAGLRISSKLMRLARVVRTDAGTGDD